MDLSPPLSHWQTVFRSRIREPYGIHIQSLTGSVFRIRNPDPDPLTKRWHIEPCKTTFSRSCPFFCPYILLSFHPYILPSYHPSGLIILPSCPSIIPSFYPSIFPSLRPYVPSILLPFHPLGLSSSLPSILPAFHPPAITSSCHYILLPLHPPAIPSSWPSILLLFHTRLHLSEEQGSGSGTGAGSPTLGNCLLYVCFVYGLCKQNVCCVYNNLAICTLWAFCVYALWLCTSYVSTLCLLYVQYVSPLCLPCVNNVFYVFVLYLIIT